MEYSTLLLKHQTGSPDAYWTYNNVILDRLVIAVFQTTYNGGSWLIAYGIDPAHTDPERDSYVFWQILGPRDLGTFLQFLLDGSEVENSPIELQGLDITTSQPPPPGPNVVFAYADSLTADDGLLKVA
jgi:hypothetical protein